MSGKGYGEHPTKYGKLTNDDLYAMYRSESWSKLGEQDRQALLQETVNRAAAERGELGSCEVRFSSNLDRNEAGRQFGNVILLNRSMFVDDKKTYEYNGRPITAPLQESNFLALETALHENEHAWQNQCIKGTIRCSDAKQLIAFRANNHSPVNLTDKDGNVLKGSTYLNGVNKHYGYELYYFQSTELAARLVSERKTMEIVNSLEKKYGTDLSIKGYRDYIAASGYQATFQKACAIFGSKDFARQINNSLMNHYYGASLPVDPKIEALVKQEMIDSYNAQNRVEQETNADQQNKAGQQNNTAEQKPAEPTKGETMSNINDAKVTMEDYHNSLHNSVNAFYEHAMNDPTMSKEEAMQETAQMAERALTAEEEAQAFFASSEQEAGNAVGEEAGSAGVSANTTGGMENGTEGGAEEGIGGDDDGGIGDD